MKKYSFTAVAVALSAMTWSMTAWAQDDYEDDIYYNASKSEAKASQPVQRQTLSAYQPGITVADGAYYIDNTAGTFPSADSYTAGAASPLDVDVDTYNRRGQFLVADTIVDSGSDSEDSFASTRRIERFHNPDIVEGSGDDALMDYYYAEQPATNVNVYVIEANPFYSPYYYTPWSYRNSLYYNPYYWGFTTWGWDPYWSISWGWGYYPGWSWGWGYYPGWSWGWGCYPGHHHHDYGHWQPTPGGGHYNGGYRPSHNSGSHTASAVSGVQRPGNMGRGRVSSGSASSTISRRQSLTGGRTTFRPIGNSSTGSTTGIRTGNSDSKATTISRPGNMGSGRSVSKQPSTYQPVQRNNSSSSSSSNNSYTPSSSSRGRSSSSSSSFSSGSSRSSHSMSGGSRSMGGGGGGRGRR